VITVKLCILNALQVSSVLIQFCCKDHWISSFNL